MSRDSDNGRVVSIGYISALVHGQVLGFSKVGFALVEGPTAWLGSIVVGCDLAHCILELASV